MAIKKHRLAREVIGLSQSHSTLSLALKNQAIDKGFTDLKRSLQNADLVILSTPVNTIIHLLSTIGPHLRRHCIVTDVGSTKLTIVNKAEKNLPPYVTFVGSHPLAGSEKKGAEYANPDLFQNSTCILTPTEKTHRGSIEKLKVFWTKLGTNVKVLTPEEHDKILTYISHLPHVVAYALIGAIPAEHLIYAAQGLKDTTRIASSSPQMWNDICMANNKNIVESIDEIVKNLSGIRKTLMSQNQQNLVDIFTKAKAKRDSLEQS